MELIDTHVHLNFSDFEKDIDQIQENWLRAGVVKLIHSCVDPGEFRVIQSLADRFKEISFAVGLHPLEAHQWTSASFQEIYTLAKSDPRVVAIGETGLDYYKAQNSPKEQEIALEGQLNLAKQLDKAIIIHCRDAASALRTILQKFHQDKGGVRGVMHCWSGNWEETQWCLDLGYYISFSGVVTFKNALSIQEAAQKVPSDRLLIETDCPFLAPVPKRGKRNEPAYVNYIANFLAQLRNEPLETLAKNTTENAYRLFHLT